MPPVKKLFKVHDIGLACLHKDLSTGNNTWFVIYYSHSLLMQTSFLLYRKFAFTKSSSLCLLVLRSPLLATRERA